MESPRRNTSWIYTRFQNSYFAFKEFAPFPQKKIEDSRVYQYKQLLKGDDFRTIFLVVITADDKSEDELQRDLSLVSIITNFNRNNGERVWLVTSEQKLTVTERKQIKKVMRNTKLFRRKDTPESVFTGARGMMLVADNFINASNAPVFLDGGLGYENIFIDRWITKFIDRCRFFIKGTLKGTYNPLAL